ncbi:MAG: biotin synthase BioB, partial [Moorea sp. SIO4E2]|nr:biotin synthase BioB [Moorena sp. SIO4E2]
MGDTVVQAPLSTANGLSVGLSNTPASTPASTPEQCSTSLASLNEWLQKLTEGIIAGDRITREQALAL